MFYLLWNDGDSFIKVQSFSFILCFMDFKMLTWDFDTKSGVVNSFLTFPSSRAMLSVRLTVVKAIINISIMLLSMCGEILGLFDNNSSSICVNYINYSLV